MYMRFVRLKYEEDRVWDAKEFYERRVLPLLEQTEGCVFAGLLQGTIHGEDFISMTVWTSADAAAEYEGSGIFDRLLDESDEVLLGTEVWSTDLPGGDLVVFSGVEPEVEAWNVAGPVDEAVLEHVADGRVFVRMVSIRVRVDALDEFLRRFDEEVRPALAETPGCLGAFLVAGVDDPARMLSVTVWAREEDAVRYGLSGQYERLTARLKDTFSDLYQWSATRSDDPVAASVSAGRVPDVEGYHLVVGRKLT